MRIAISFGLLQCSCGHTTPSGVGSSKLFVNTLEVPMWKNGKFIIPQSIPKTYSQSDIFLHSKTNINKDNMGPIYIPKTGDSFKIDEETNWRYLLPIIIMEGHKATLQDDDVTLTFTLQDQFEIGRRLSLIHI